MPRSSWKVPVLKKSVLDKVRTNHLASKKQIIKTWSRQCTIIPSFVGTTFGIHNGKKFVSVLITEQMVGHKLGEFASTRIFHSHSGDKKVSK